MKVVIVGAGFGGLRLARKLNNKKGYEVLLVDRFNYHQFQPLFYQVATASLDPSNISFPLRKLFQKSRNVRIRMAHLQKVVPEAKKIITDTEEIAYDVLVLAMGADTNFFGMHDLASNAFPMKSTVEALQLRYRVLKNLEDAVRADDPDERHRLLNIVIAGGGPTGVELAGALAEMKKYILPKDYPELDFAQMNIYLVEGAAHTLAAMSGFSSRKSKEYLERLGVDVRIHTMVKGYDGKKVMLGDGQEIPAATVIWAAGIKGNVPEGIDDPSLVAKGNRIIVDAQCRVKGKENIYAIGDLAHMETNDYPHGHPQVAQGAIQQADLLVKNFRRERAGKEPEAFIYKDKGSMATVGRNLAVVDLPRPKLHFGGLLAWLVWMSLHLMLILGVKNKLFVFMNWVYKYATYDQNLRLIFSQFRR